MEKLDFSPIPIWVRINNLPLHWWLTGIIGQISSALGTPLHMHQATTSTTRISFARVCVEVGANKSLLDNVLVSINGEVGVSINFEY